MLEDTQIIALFFQRSESALNETDQKYGRLLHRVSRSIVQNPQDAEECVSDTYINTWNTIPPKKPNNFRAFLLKLVRNISLNRLEWSNRQKRGGGAYQAALEELEETLSEAGQTTDLADELALRDCLNRFLAQLSEQQRAVFVGRYWYFASVKDIAADLELTPSNVKMILLRCRRTLLEWLKKEGFAL